MNQFLIVDDHPLFRSALSAAVRRVLPHISIREATSLAEATTALEREQVDMLLLDLHMSDSDGFAGLINIRHDYPHIPVIIVSALEGSDIAHKSVSFGAAGYIPKSLSVDDICTALQAVMDGDIWLPEGYDGPAAGSEEEIEKAEKLASLTPAQVKVLLGIREGRLNKQIASDHGITEATVKAHVTAIFRKLGVINRTQAVLFAESLAVERPSA